MAIPKYNEFFNDVLKSLSDGQPHTYKDIDEYCSSVFKLSDNDKRETLASGTPVFNNRVGWARTYLKKAGLIISPKRGEWKITDLGIKALNDNVTVKYLEQFESFYKFYYSGTNKSNIKCDSKVEFIQSPQEAIDSAFFEINSSLADDLLAEVLKMDPYDFEKLIVKLLIKMGYGSPELNQNATTKKSGDGGIDGIVKADKLGFDSIYTQAKLWNKNSSVSRPEIQKFLGAMDTFGATKGVFITTSYFSKEALEVSKNKQLLKKIVLIDGNKLAELMIEYNLGVSVTTTYEIKKIDYDFFNDEM